MSKTEPLQPEMFLPGLWWSLSTGLLFAATLPVWRLDNDSLLPRIPLFGWGLSIPHGVEVAAVIGAFSAVVYVACRSYRQERATIGVIVWMTSSGVLIVADQLRFQPWWIHLMVTGIILSCASPRRIPQWWIWFLVGMYGWSAWSKWDYSFLATHGRELVLGILQGVGVRARLTPTAHSCGAVMLPLVESLVVSLLLFSRTRRWGLWIAVGMHLLLGIALGPTGLNHSRGVLAWNAVCVAQLIVLIVLTRPSASAAAQTATILPKPSRGDRVAATIVGLVMSFPLLAPWGLCDPWWAWELYASRPGRVDISMACSHRKDLPSSVRRYVEPELPGREWCRVRIDRWALDELSVAVAPGLRVQMALATSFCEQYTGERECRVEIAEIADRWTGMRTSRTLISNDDIRRELATFRFNVNSRDRDSGH